MGPPNKEETDQFDEEMIQQQGGNSLQEDFARRRRFPTRRILNEEVVSGGQ
jgi:hypothetical protein